MWTYEQATGFWIDPTGRVVFRQGYAGNGTGKNNPDLQMVHSIGPIPRGTYTAGEPCDDIFVGRYAMRLTPAPNNEMFGRTDFFMHGDSESEPGKASKGCIVLPRFFREHFWESNDHVIEVVRGGIDIDLWGYDRV